VMETEAINCYLYTQKKLPISLLRIFDIHIHKKQTEQNILKIFQIGRI
jgi:hypothetical protein